MAVEDQTQLVLALERCEAESVIGTPESVWVDFKDSRAWDLTTDHGKWELAKDVAAMANVDGGLIVVGIKTKSGPHDTHEVAADLRPFDKTTYKIDSMKTAIKNWLSPPQTVSFAWFRSEQESDKYYLVLTVRPVPEHERYVLTVRAETDSGKYVPAVGVPLRTGDDTRWLSGDELYRLINDGLLRRRVESPVRSRAGATATSGVDPREAADRALDELQRSQGWEHLPVILWQSYTDPTTADLPALYSHDGVRGFLDGPNALREGGFHFHNPYVPTVAVETGLLLPSRNGLAVHIGFDGTVTAGAVANKTILARTQDWDQFLPVSAIVLTELTYEYFRVVDEQVVPRVSGDWRHRVTVRRFKEHNVTLSPGRTGELAFAHPHEATTDAWQQAWTADGDPSVDAATALRAVYNLFGLDAATNPWFVDERVDMPAFLAEMGRR